MLPHQGFIVVSGPFDGSDLIAATHAFEAAEATAQPDEVKSSATNVRVNGVLERAPILAALASHPPLVAAAAGLIGGAYRLSCFHSRSVRPGAAAQALHQDVAPGSDGWPLLGFIFMVDPFTPENGATRFVPSSADLTVSPSPHAATPACGLSGSVLIFNGSVWHGFGENRSKYWRRSIQGAFVPA